MGREMEASDDGEPMVCEGARLMRIGLFHGYELTGSGSNEYTRHLACFLAEAGHEVHVICREPDPSAFAFVSRAVTWTPDGATTLFDRTDEGEIVGTTVHVLPHGDVRPVFLTDKQRAGNVKSFVSLTDDELGEYHRLTASVLTRILMEVELDVLHANHLVYQPVAALKACTVTSTPLIIFPHGSSIEYTVKADSRYRNRALEALLLADGVITGNCEVRDRIVALFPEEGDEILRKTQIIGVGVDTRVFMPVARAARQEAIAQICTPAPGGKTASQRAELAQRLADEGVEATQVYREAYDHSVADADLADRIAAIPWDEDILLFVGALTVGKGLQSVITALPEVLRERPNAHLVVVGSGSYREVLAALVTALSTGDEALLTELCARGMDLDRNELTGPWEDVAAFLADDARRRQLFEDARGLDEHVWFLGRLDEQSLRYVFPCSDLAVFPSVIPEAYPLVLMESLASGVLRLVSYFSGFRDGVDDLARLLGDNVAERMKLPVDPEARIESIARAISKSLGDPEVRALPPRLRQVAVEHLDWRQRAQEMVLAYSVLIAYLPQR